jgi:glucosamine-phosphate N-acetyltransferase
MTFDSSLISNTLQQALPFHFQLRPLRIDDWERGFLPCLAELTVVGKVSKQAFIEQFLKLSSSGKYFICVIEDVRDKSIAAAGTLFAEEKFIHMNGKVGHVEDIVVRKRYRGMNLGKL